MSCQETFFAKLRARGFRLTPQRRNVLDAMHHLPELATAEEIQAAVRAAGVEVDTATVYRTLELLQELGFVTVVDRGASERRYSLLSGEPPHLHLVCEVCGSVTPASPTDLAFVAELEARFGFAPSMDRLTITGRCASCRGTAAPAEPAPRAGDRRSKI
jgi:Fur family transcriptional regulator, ferric uptake regulator